MSIEPPPPVNPYAPTEALAHGEAAPPAGAQSPRWRPLRTLAIIAALVSAPLAGAGLFVLGRRSAVIWTIAGLCCYAAMVASVFAKAPAVCIVAFALAVAVWLATLVFTMFAREGTAPLGTKAALVVLLLSILVARGGAVATKEWAAEAYHIPSGGMIPTLDVGDRIMVAKTKRIDPGDVVVFRYPLDPSIAYAKRAVAIGGQVVEISDGVVAVDGIPLKQLALVGDCPSPGNDPTGMPIDRSTCRLLQENAGKGWYSIMRDSSWSPPSRRFVVPPGHLFVLGDNRDNSSDSRVWGAVPLDLVDGRAAFIWWSRDPHGTTHWDRIGKKID